MTRAEGLNPHIPTGASAMTGQVGITSPELAGKIPRMPGPEAVFPGKQAPSLLGMEKYRQAGAPQAFRQMPACPLDSPTASADCFVHDPGLEENSFLKKQFKKKYGKYPQPKWGGKSPRQARS